VGLRPGWVKPKTIKLVFGGSPLRTQHWGERLVDSESAYLGEATYVYMCTRGLLFQRASTIRI